MTADMRRAAHLRMVFLAKDHRTLTPLEIADQQTSMADARIALNLACGVPIEMITSLGYDNTDAAYADVRASWVRHVEESAWHGQFDWPALDKAYGYWLGARPDLAAGDDWFADGWLAHLARYPDGQCDPHSYCEICQPFTSLGGES
jgi:hypothetical protein